MSSARRATGSPTTAPRRAALGEGSAGVQALLAQFRPRLAARMPPDELRAELAVAAGFLAVAVPLALWLPARHHGSTGIALLFVVLVAVMSRIEFDVGSGYGVPTQLVLVPMLFAVPAGLVPLLVAAGLVLGKVPTFLTGSRHPDRAIMALADSWHAIGPALVIGVAGIAAPRWSNAGIVVAALAAELACDLGATVVREWLRLGAAPQISVRLLASVYVTDICLAPVGVMAAVLVATHPASVLFTLPLAGLLTFFARDRRARIEQAVELSHAYRGTALLLGDVVEADDAYTGSHSRQVVDLSVEVGRRMGLGPDAMRDLEFAALLHDVGKIVIPKEIINKQGPLSDDERALINTHTIAGQTMLDGVGGVLAGIGGIVRSCHERYDGLGYPDGLAGEAIPVAARIVSCCDAFSAMTTDRSYRRALDRAEALGELEVHAGAQFDPEVVHHLVASASTPAHDVEVTGAAPVAPAPTA